MEDKIVKQAFANNPAYRVVVKKPVTRGKVEVKEIAFGLKGVDVTVMVPDSEGGLDPIVEILSGIEKVDNVEVVDVGRV